MRFQGAFETRCLATQAPNELSFFTSSLSIVFVLTNVPGNLLVILAVVIDPNKNLRSPFNWLIVNLAMADLIVGTITDLLSVNMHLKEGLKLKVKSEELWALHVSYFISCTASMLSLSTLAIERYLAIRKPLHYKNSFTGKRILLTIAGIWLISLSLLQVYSEVGYITGAFIFANTSIIMAIFITTITYTLILHKVKERSQNTTKANEVIPVPYPTPPSAPSAIPKRAPPNSHISKTVFNSGRLMERKITKMFIILLIGLLCCYGASTIAVYVMYFCESCNCSTLYWFRDIPFIFVIMNSSVNFYCYALRSPRFRSAFFKNSKANRSSRRINLLQQKCNPKTSVQRH